jgi:hypothetical protein
MNNISKTIFAATALVAAFGSMASNSKAEAGVNFGINIGGPGIFSSYHAPRYRYHRGYHHAAYSSHSCWRPVWNGYKYVQQKFYGSACY